MAALPQSCMVARDGGLYHESFRISTLLIAKDRLPLFVPAGAVNPAALGRSCGVDPSEPISPLMSPSLSASWVCRRAASGLTPID